MTTAGIYDTLYVRMTLLRVVDQLIAYELTSRQTETWIYIDAITHDAACMQDSIFKLQSACGKLAVMASCDRSGHALLFLVQTILDRNLPPTTGDTLDDMDSKWRERSIDTLIDMMAAHTSATARRFRIDEPIVLGSGDHRQLSWVEQQCTRESDGSGDLSHIDALTDFWTPDMIRTHV
jgi:hypothetical protein